MWFLTSCFRYRTSGVPQSELCKKFRMKGNNFHFIAKSLESQRLIVRQSTIIKMKDHGAEREDASQNKHIINTNSLYLSRYAKDLNMTSQQRIEITKPELLGSNEEANVDAFRVDGAFDVNSKNDISIHDYLPAMKAICDKLEEASGKVDCSHIFPIKAMLVFAPKFSNLLICLIISPRLLLCQI